MYNSTSRIRNRKEKRSWLGFAQVTVTYFPHRVYGECSIEEQKAVNVLCVFIGLSVISGHEQSQHGSHQDQSRDSGAGGHYYNAWYKHLYNLKCMLDQTAACFSSSYLKSAFVQYYEIIIVLRLCNLHYAIQNDVPD